MRKLADPEANLILGVVFDPKPENEVKITLTTRFAPQATVTPASFKEMPELGQRERAGDHCFRASPLIPSPTGSKDSGLQAQRLRPPVV